MTERCFQERKSFRLVPVLRRAEAQAVSRLTAWKYLPGIRDPDEHCSCIWLPSGMGGTGATAESLTCSTEIPQHMEEAGATGIFKWLVDLYSSRTEAMGRYTSHPTG